MANVTESPRETTYVVRVMLNLFLLYSLGMRGTSQLVNFRSGGCFGNGLPAAFMAQ